MEEEKPNYYAVIPASVRYDEKLKPMEKLLYGEITALTYKTGECWASNNYFARLYKATPQAISRWILNLSKFGYVAIDYEYSGKAVKKRVIKVSTHIDRGINTELTGYQHTLIGYQHTVEENNTSNNITSINNKKEIYKEICERVITRLNELNGTKYSTTSEGNTKYIRGRLEDGYKEEDLMLVVEKMSYLWNQPSEKDMRPYLRPSTLFRPTNFENYLNIPVNKKRTTKGIKLDLNILTRKETNL